MQSRGKVQNEYLTLDPYRFQIRKTGFMLGHSGENGPLSDDRSNFLPVSTKTSSNEDENSESGSEKMNNSLSLSSRNLPPVYVDIQEEVE